MTSGIFDVLQFSIDAVSNDTNAIANNIANQQTPGFQASDVDFQSSLGQALASPGTATATATLSPTGGAENAEGNDVSLSTELVGAEHDALQYQQLSESITAQLRLIRGASGGGWQ